MCLGRQRNDVLILVVVEDGLREDLKISQRGLMKVLILVVVEDGLREGQNLVAYKNLYKSLNPCCGGRWSQSVIGNRVYYTNNGGCLNPCCGGRWSQRDLDETV